MFYEYHKFNDEDLKIIHHIDTFEKSKGFLAHLHYNVELILMRNGSAEIAIDDQTVVINENELAVIAPNKIHKLNSIGEICEYYCLIIDHSVYEDWFKAEKYLNLISPDYAILADGTQIYHDGELIHGYAMEKWQSDGMIKWILYKK